MIFFMPKIGRGASCFAWSIYVILLGLVHLGHFWGKIPSFGAKPKFYVKDGKSPQILVTECIFN